MGSPLASHISFCQLLVDMRILELPPHSVRRTFSSQGEVVVVTAREYTEMVIAAGIRG
jgi:hypothetical protein